MPKRGQVIVDDYLRRIVAGELPEGTLLPTESAMIEQYQVSRTAVREAVQALAHKGFIRIRQGSGSTVTPRSSWNVLDSDYLALTGGSDALADNIAQAREIVEPPVAGLAATKATEQQIDQLRMLVSDMRLTSDPTDLAKADADFHSAVAEASGNLVLRSLLNSLTTLGATVPPAHDDSVEARQIVTWSEQVLDAIASHDPVAAQDTMRMHLRKVHR